jgi:hypothetical protein
MKALSPVGKVVSSKADVYEMALNAFPTESMLQDAETFFVANSTASGFHTWVQWSKGRRDAFAFADGSARLRAIQTAGLHDAATGATARMKSIPVLDYRSAVVKSTLHTKHAGQPKMKFHVNRW